MDIEQCHLKNTSFIYAPPEHVRSRNGYEVVSSWIGAVGIACLVAFVLHLLITCSNAVVFVFRNILAKPRKATAGLSKALRQVPALRLVEECLYFLHTTFYLDLT